MHARTFIVVFMCKCDLQFASESAGQSKPTEKLSSELVERLNQLVGPLEEGEHAPVLFFFISIFGLRLKW